MQFAPLDKKERAAFREMLERADGGKLGAAALLCALSALAIPFSHIEAVSGLYLIYVAVFYYALTRSFSSLLTLAAPGAFLYGLSGMLAGLPHPYLLPAVYAALIMGPVATAFLVLHCREKKFLPMLLLPVALYLLPALVLDPVRALAVLLPLAMGAVLGLSLLNCTAQTPTLVRVAAVLAVGAAGAYLVWLWRIGATAQNPLITLTDLLHRFLGGMFQALEAQAAAQGIPLGFSEVDIFNVGALLGNILPGLFLALCGVMAFGIFRTMLRLLISWGTLTRVPIRLGALTVSPVAAALFLACYLAALFSGADLFGTVCENLVTVLQPALFLVGISALFAREGGRYSMLSLILLVGLLVLFWNYPSYAITAAALLGAVRVLLAAILTRRKKGGS